MWDEITYPFPNFNIVAIEVWEWTSNFIAHFTGHLNTYPCLKLAHVCKKGPGRTVEYEEYMYINVIVKMTKIFILPEPVLKTWDSKCLPLVAQMVRAFSMNPKVGVPLRSRHFLSKKFDTFTRKSICVSKKICYCPCTINISNVNFT